MKQSSNNDLTQQIVSLRKELFSKIDSVSDKLDNHSERLVRIETSTNATNGGLARAFCDIDEAKKRIEWNKTMITLGLGGLYAIGLILAVVSYLT
jgi:uncharacterized coiled-coil DUF342 family protein